ncbi:MAG: hypothetical protein ACO242_03705 [Candidatus Fonsibacter ubiquis]
MTRDDIVKWAQEAAIMPPDWGATENQWRSLEAFANLVAAAERERIIAANAPEIEKLNVYIKALEDAVAAEREACAKVCESAGPGAGPVYCAFAIRERGAP